ncbi:bcl-2-related ovarian killer protein homolog B-like [Diadema setosum]|uniref:bcl-2-related ovarian killer protein homolog B-like n=1 Tax=Diadema setosum TaxID=31175 RepID=UPI003B3BD85C
MAGTAEDIVRFMASRRHPPQRQLSQVSKVGSGSPTPDSVAKKFTKYLSESSLLSTLATQTGLGLPWEAREEDVKEQSSAICKEFIHSKLKRLGFLGGSAKSGLRASMSIRGQKASPVCRELQVIGSELERLYPNLFRDITKQLNVTISSEATVEQVVFDIGNAIFKSGITWAKIVAFFVVSSALSVECLQQGNGIFIHSVTVWLTRYVQTKLVKWIAQQGGWVDLLRTFKRKRRDTSGYWVMTLGAVLFGLALILIAARMSFHSPWTMLQDPHQ